MSTDTESTTRQSESESTDESRWSKHAGRLVLILLYSLVILSVGANVRVWYDLFNVVGAN